MRTLGFFRSHVAALGSDVPALRMFSPRASAFRLTLGFVSIGVFALLSACASAPTRVAPAVAKADTGLDRMERLTLTANRCWIKSKDPTFAAYTVAPELSSFSGKPRFLLVPRGKPEERPLLVVEGKSGSTNVATYGPLMNEKLAGRIAGDIGRWGNGSTSCTA